MANSARSKGRRFVPKDFIPRWDRKPEQSWQEQLATVKAINRALGGADLTGG